tara:strand:- start:1815 stop:2408 length:594 start_codon:yes stop_codon:yes gene_type:complete
MNYYETVYIIHPALQEGRLKDIVNKFHKKLEDDKGKVLYVTNWGKKKLAYPIDKQKYGTYILCQYSIDGDKLKTVSQELELNPNILRYLITKIDQTKVLEGSNELTVESDTKKTTQQEKESSLNSEQKNKSTDQEIAKDENSLDSNKEVDDENLSDSEKKSDDESALNNKEEILSDENDNEKQETDEEDNSSDDNKE